MRAFHTGPGLQAQHGGPRAAMAAMASTVFLGLWIGSGWTWLMVDDSS